jgi:hypothetical protein
MVGWKESAQAHETDRCRAPGCGSSTSTASRTHARSPFRIHTYFLARNKVIIFLFLMLSSTPMHTTHIIVLSLPGDCQMTGFHRCIALLRLYLLGTRDLLRTLSSTVVLGVYETEVQLTKERQQQ